MLLDLARVDGLALRVHAGRDHVRPLVHVGQEQGRADCGPVVQSRAPVAVTTRADLEIEGAVDAVLLRSEYRSQVLRHCFSVAPQVVKALIQLQFRRRRENQVSDFDYP